MATRTEIAEYILNQSGDAGDTAVKKMFGEFALYCGGKVVAFICDDQLFIKPTPQGRDYLGEIEEAPPYPGAKNYYLIPEDNWDDRVWLSGLVRITADALPQPKPKKPRKRG